jgi:hypothetical protein
VTEFVSVVLFKSRLISYSFRESMKIYSLYKDILWNNLFDFDSKWKELKSWCKSVGHAAVNTDNFLSLPAFRHSEHYGILYAARHCLIYLITPF